MTVIATVAVSTADFSFGETFRELPDARISLERLVPLGDQVIPYFWVEGVEGALGEEDYERALEGPVTENVTVLDRVEDRALLRIAWRETVDGLLAAISSHGGTVLEGLGTPEEWTFQLRFPTYEDLSAFYRECAGEGIALDFVHIYNPVGEHGSNDRFGLTDAQREALITAIETGYFAVPREISLAELGDRLGISDAAVSERLRRGQATLVAATLLAAPATGEKRDREPRDR